MNRTITVSTQRRPFNWLRLMLVIFLTAVGSVSGPIHLAQAAHGASQPASAAWLNPDGTVNLHAGLQGALDLRGWQVTLDGRRGPLFAPAGSSPARPEAPSWYHLETGMQGFVYAIAVISDTLYAGGDFTYAGSCATACRHIAQWDGAT